MRLRAEMGYEQRIEEVKKLAGLIMHKHYCEHDAEWIASHFAPQFSWLGTGEAEYLSGREACVNQFIEFRDFIPDCTIQDEEYDVICPNEDMYVAMGRMWIATDQSVEMYLKVHQRVTLYSRIRKRG